MLENVSGLVRINKGEYYRAILQALEALNMYDVYSKILDTKEHGIPHNRKRIYFVGISKRHNDGSFSFPDAVACPSIKLFLDPPGKQQVVKGCLPPKSSGTAYANVRQALKELSAQKSCKPYEVPYVVDCDSSGARMKYMKEVTPCLTCSRAKGHWVTSLGRRLKEEEMMRLQGMLPEKFKIVVPRRQLGIQIGNAMSVNVLERIFVRALPAARLVPHNALADRWKRGKTPSELIAARTKKRPIAHSRTDTGKPKRKRI